MYSLMENKEATNVHDKVKLVVTKEVALRKPGDFKINKVSSTGRFFASFTFLSPEEERVLAENGLSEKITYKALLQKKGGEDSGKEHSLRKEEEDCFSFVPDFIEAETTYTVKVKATIQGKESEWSEEAEFTTPKFSECCVWKKCPCYVYEQMKYSVDEKNPRIATNISGCYCTIIGNTALPQNNVTSWSIKILKSRDKGYCIFVGIAPFDINQNKYENYENCGWFFYCYISTLCSGPPQLQRHKAYGPRKELGQYVHTGDSVGVVMDTIKGELSFVVDGENFGVAYDGIPLDKPLVPCVILWYGDDSVELDTSEVKVKKDGWYTIS